jgi:hypothetical protein
MDRILNGTLDNTMVDKPIPQAPSSLVLPNVTADNAQNIKSLSVMQKTPQQLLAFQKMMHLSSTEAYKQRQAQELKSTIGEGGQFDPSKVSGNTFASIIGNLEQNRGKEVSGISSAISGATTKVQDEATKRLNAMQELENAKKDAEQAYKDAKKAAKKMLTGKSAAKKKAKHEYESFIRDYNQKIIEMGRDNAYLDFSVPEIVQSIQDLKDRNYSFEQIHGALVSEGIPTFPSSVASDYLNSIFK